MTMTSIPSGLRLHFQEYDLQSYGADHVRTFVRVRGERMLSRVTFNY